MGPARECVAGEGVTSVARLGDNYYVVRHNGHWAVRREGAERVSSEHRTQGAAIERGRDLAREQEGELRIQGRNSQFRDSDSYGSDPCPPRDRKH